MKKRFLVEVSLAAIAAAVMLLSCPTEEPHSSGSPQKPPSKTLVVFDNTHGICAATIYSDYRRREQDKIAEIPAGDLSEEIEWTPGASVPFFFSYTISLNGINGFELDFVPAVGKDQMAVRIDSGVTNKIIVPKLDETLSSSEQLLSNSSYLLIQNNSSSSFKLYRGTSSEISPDGSSSSAMVNAGERARYTINPGTASNYRLLVGADYRAFTGSVSSFEAGHVYSFIFNGNVSLISDTEITLENIVNPSAAFVEFKNTEQFPVTIYSNSTRQVVLAEKIEANGTKLVLVTPSPTRAFYPTFYLLYQIDATSIDIPYNGPTFFAAIESGKINQVPVPNLESIELNSAYIMLKNESNVSLLLKEGSGNKNPIGGGSPLVNPGQNAAYEVTPGPCSAYTLLHNTTTPVAFPSSLTEFRRGIIYVLTYSGTSFTLTNEMSVLQTIPPAVPENVQAEIISNNSVRITWDGVYGATSYRIYRATGSPDASYSQIANTATSPWTDTGLAAGQVYSYKISALSGTNMESGQSAAVSAFMTAAGNVLVNAVTDNSVSLAWNAVSGASGYYVYRSDSENGNYSKVNTVAITGTAFTDTGLATFVTYYYKIRPVSSGAEGMQSTPVSGTTLLAAPSNVRISAVNGSTISLAWDAVNVASGYNIYRSASVNGTYNKVNTAAVTGTVFTNTGLNVSTTYYYRITAVKGDNEGVRSNAVSGVTLASAPGNVRVSSVTDNSISLAWNAVSLASGYNVYRSVSENGTYTRVNTNTVTGVTFTDTGLNAFTVYYYKVSPVSGGADGILSSPVSGTTLLAAPLNVRVSSISGGSISLAWNTVNGASGYNIYRSASENGTYSKVNSTTVTGITFTDTGLAVLTTYYYRICAVTGNNEGVRSNAVSGTTLSLRINAVTINSISLAWNAVSGISGYNVYRSESENGPYARINAGTITDTAFNDTNVSPYTIIYYYKISAVSSGIEGEQTNLVPSAFPVPGNDLAEKLAWLKNSTVSNLLYSVEVDTDEYIEPQLLSYSGKNGIAIILSGKMMCTINPSGQGRLFSIYSGVTLILNDNITLKGIPNNIDPLVNVSGTLIMNSGTKIIDNSNTGGTYSYGAGVGVDSSGGTFIMNGGEISGNSSSNNGAGGVFMGGGTFTMNGGKISENSARNGGVSVGLQAFFTMNGGEISGNSSEYNGGGVYVSGGTLTMNGGKISGNSASFNGGGVYITGANSIRGTFTMSGGDISDNTAPNIGGGVYVNAGTFTMNSGKISRNSAGSTGGVHVFEQGTFTMNGGKISENSARNGGGVSVDGGAFTMYNGEISGNSAFATSATSYSSSYGGGVYISRGTFIMHNGEISGNSVSATSSFSYSLSYGGGVYVSSNATFTMNGGEISGNTTSSSSSGGGGVYATGGTFTMTGGKISGNSTGGNGGGVYGGGGTFIMHDGEIFGNSATSGGGVYVSHVISSSIVYEVFSMSGGVIYGSNAADNLQNIATNGTALYNTNSNNTVEYGTFSGDAFTKSGDLDTTDTTIRMVNGNLQTN